MFCVQYQEKKYITKFKLLECRFTRSLFFTHRSLMKDLQVKKNKFISIYYVSKSIDLDF